VNLPLNYPPADRGTLVVWGYLGSYPFGGMTWQALHYLAGFRRLGFDVWYVQESERPLLHAETFEPTREPEANATYLARYMEAIGLGDRWVLRPPGATACVGALDREGLERLYAGARLVVNVCGAQELLPHHDAIASLVYVQTDPVSDQVRVAAGDGEKIRELDAYDCLFTYGENLGGADCPVPLERYVWHPTRPPVVVDWWATDEPPEDRTLTTIAKWRHTDKDVRWNGSVWRWSKHPEFARFLLTAQRVGVPLEIAVSAISDEELAELRRHGWRTRPSALLKSPAAYRRYIRGSLGEFTAAKEQYVATRSGWFSDRSVCYLAAGRPVVMQDTGFRDGVPVGEGLLLVRDLDGAVAAVDDVVARYGRHAAAARAIAEEHFAAERVLGDLLTSAGVE